MLRITRQADYGIVLLGELAGLDDDRVLTAKELAAHTGIPQPMVGKILKTLTRVGILASHRGATGGYALQRAPEELSLLEIVECLDGPVSLTTCCDVVEAGSCEIKAGCRPRINWHRINGRIRGLLSETTLADMTAPARYGEACAQKTER